MIVPPIVGSDHGVAPLAAPTCLSPLGKQIAILNKGRPATIEVASGALFDDLVRAG
jgi:hypothetical protein